MIETKLIDGLHTQYEALDLKVKGWRMPTIFELKIIRAESDPTGFFWSASPYAVNSNYAWYVHFNSGVGSHANRHYYRLVRLVRDDTDFDYLHPVTLDEIMAFDESGKLPEWHPQIGG